MTIINRFTSTNAFDKSNHGSADVLLYINAKGRPKAATATFAASPAVGAAAINVVSGWSFSPAKCDGSPIPGTTEVHFQP